VTFSVTQALTALDNLKVLLCEHPVRVPSEDELLGMRLVEILPLLREATKPCGVGSRGWDG